MRVGAVTDELAFASIWDALELDRAQAANLRLRSELMIALRRAVKGWELTQAAAAKRLGTTQPRLNDLLCGRIGKFSLDALVLPGARVGLSLQLQVAAA